MRLLVTFVIFATAGALIAVVGAGLLESGNLSDAASTAIMILNIPGIFLCMCFGLLNPWYTPLTTLVWCNALAYAVIGLALCGVVAALARKPAIE